jgi:hypothetical protein
MRDPGTGRSVEDIENLVIPRRDQMPRLAPQKTIAALMLAFAIIVPGAHARPIDSPGVGTAPSSTAAHHQQSGDLPLAVARTASGANPAAPSHVASASPAVSSASSFDWGDAGIGAGAALLVMSLGAAGFVAIRRRGQPALTS